MDEPKTSGPDRWPGGAHSAAAITFDFDAEEVFFIQTVGHKRMELRRNAQHPSPLSRKIPAELRAVDETTPLVAHVLEPGDVLYIPAGFWHRYASPVTSPA